MDLKERKQEAKQLDIFGEEHDVCLKKIKRKNLKEPDINILDKFPTSDTQIAKDIEYLKNKYLGCVIDYVLDTVQTYDEDRGRRYYNVLHFYQNICTCGNKWINYSYSNKCVRSKKTCPCCNSKLIIPKQNVEELIVGQIKSIKTTDTPIFYMYKTSETAIRINRYIPLLYWDKETKSLIKELNLFSYADIDFKVKTIKAYKILSKNKLKPINIADFFVLSKKASLNIDIVNQQSLSEFLHSNPSIKKYSGLNEYLYTYDKYFKNNDVYNRYEMILNDSRLIVSLILAMDTIPNIELLLKSYVSIATTEIIRNIILAYYVAGIKANMQKLEYIMNPEAKNLKNAINCPQFILKDLYDKNICTLDNIKYYIDVYQGHNFENKTFKAVVQNLSETEYPDILDIYAETYKSNDGIKKLIFNAKKKKLSLDEFKELVSSTKLESFGKDAYIKYVESYKKFVNKGFIFDKEQISYILNKGISIDKEVSYISKVIQEMPETKNMLITIDKFLVDENVKKQCFYSYVAEKFSQYLGIHIDYIKMAIETTTNADNMVDVQIDKFPQNLILAHDRVSELKSAMLNKNNDEKIKKNGETLQKYFDKFVEDKKYFKESPYTLVFPKSTYDISAEAQMQRNCIAGYAKGFADKKNIICFFRKKDDLNKGFISVEYSHRGYIKQAYYACNQRIHDEYINDLIFKFGGFLRTFNY